MKSIKIEVALDNINNRLGTQITHKGFNEGDYTLEQILITIGVFENLKAEYLKKLENKLGITKV